LSHYFDQEDMSCDFSKFDNVQDGKLMTCLSMVCPFDPREKQALLEQVCCVARAKLFMTMLEMAIEQGTGADMSQKSFH
jgi:Lon protease-like protein